MPVNIGLTEASALTGANRISVKTPKNTAFRFTPATGTYRDESGTARNVVNRFSSPRPSTEEARRG